QWLAMNVERVGERFRFKLDIHAIREMIDDYFATDLWHVVERPRAGVEFSFVLGGRSKVFDVAALSRLRAASANGQVNVDIIESAGHWVHVDAPNETFELIRQGLGP